MIDRTKSNPGKMIFILNYHRKRPNKKQNFSMLFGG